MKIATKSARSQPLPSAKSGPHRPTLQKKLTQAPKPYTEATLLRAMETAGKAVEDEELRDLLKENGIGRPSTRAAIIETLFRRNYITKTRKALFATPTGVELIGLIKEELLKSAELTGLWEKRLREIERKEYEPQTFIEGMKTMIGNIVTEVLNDNSNRHVTAAPNPTDKRQKQAAATADPDRPKVKRLRAGSVCPLCGQGKSLKDEKPTAARAGKKVVRLESLLKAKRPIGIKAKPSRRTYIYNVWKRKPKLTRREKPATHRRMGRSIHSVSYQALTKPENLMNLAHKSRFFLLIQHHINQKRRRLA